jgi:hypothetical protein
MSSCCEIIDAGWVSVASHVRVQRVELEERVPFLFWEHKHVCDTGNVTVHGLSKGRHLSFGCFQLISDTWWRSKSVNRVETKLILRCFTVDAEVVALFFLSGSREKHVTVQLSFIAPALQAGKVECRYALGWKHWCGLRELY